MDSAVPGAPVWRMECRVLGNSGAVAVDVAVASDARVRVTDTTQVSVLDDMLILHPHSSNAPTMALLVPLPRNLTLSQQPTIALSHSPSKTIVSLSAKTTPSTNESIHPTTTSFMDADALAHTRALHCHACHASLTPEYATTLAAKDLPSEHWHELIDCWACHNEDYSHLQKGHFGTVIPARQRVLLVAPTYLVVHESDLLMDAIIVNPVEASLDTQTHGHQSHPLSTWLLIQTSNIKTQSETDLLRLLRVALGDALAWEGSGSSDSTGSNAKYIAIKLYKHSLDTFILQHKPIQPASETPPPLKILHRPYTAFLVHNLLEAANSHASYKFSLTTGNSQHPSMLLWLLNWNLHYTVSSSDTAPGREGCFLHRAVKVGFIDCTQPLSDAEQDAVLAWDADKSVERMQVEKAFLGQIVSALVDSNEAIVGDGNLKRVNAFRVGYFVADWECEE
ncbi:nitrite reductase [Chytriomyces confervae]|uniref:Nitrite reductase n=1 Tax=Chytriomyces confervae TaxID=246404 RepID=A0A507FHG0_9FUNG|nr:nitrite reductase [Chytriomyces confervae]